MRSLFSLVAVLMLLGFAGCFETKFSLGTQGESKVDPALCGDWEVNDPNAPPEKPKVQLTIRNFDGKSYFVEWTNPDEKEKDKTLRLVAWTMPVKSATFAQVRDMPTDGSIPDSHLLVRFDLKDNTLTMRQLNDKFFKEKTINSDAELKKLVEDNLDNAEMYDETDIVATRVQK